jgi:hypothetical protein
LPVSALEVGGWFGLRHRPGEAGIVAPGQPAAFRAGGVVVGARVLHQQLERGLLAEPLRVDDGATGIAAQLRRRRHPDEVDAVGIGQPARGPGQFDLPVGAEIEMQRAVGLTDVVPFVQVVLPLRTADPDPRTRDVDVGGLGIEGGIGRIDHDEVFIRHGADQVVDFVVDLVRGG